MLRPGGRQASGGRRRLPARELSMTRYLWGRSPLPGGRRELYYNTLPPGSIFQGRAPQTGTSQKTKPSPFYGDSFLHFMGTARPHFMGTRRATAGEACRAQGTEPGGSHVVVGRGPPRVGNVTTRCPPRVGYPSTTPPQPWFLMRLVHDGGAMGRGGEEPRLSDTPRPPPPRNPGFS